MITINNKEYNFKWSIRAMFIFEQISQKRFAIESTLDTYILFYSMILAANKDCKLTFDDFINAIDEDPTLIEQLDAAVQEKSSIEKILDRESKNVENL